jgi:hypothetical protein
VKWHDVKRLATAVPRVSFLQLMLGRSVLQEAATTSTLREAAASKP